MIIYKQKKFNDLKLYLNIKQYNFINYHKFLQFQKLDQPVKLNTYDIFIIFKIKLLRLFFYYSFEKNVYISNYSSLKYFNFD